VPCDNAGMRCSKDIRKRVIAFVRGGGSKAEAARHYQVSRGSIYHWLAAEDALSYKKPGPKSGRILDWKALRRHVEDHDDLTQKERAQHFGVSRHCIWNALQKMGVTRKKNDGLQGAQHYEKKKLSSSS
jgi:transposase